VTLPAGDRTPRTMVRAVFPANDTVPENLLRFYIEFSAPMSRTVVWTTSHCATIAARK
jgi:hypothetical protein